jgi:glycosyltransferase involved in cell wall biosynthesis
MRCPSLNDLPRPPKIRDYWPWTAESFPLTDNIPDGSSWPKISIVTPSYNQAEFIEETIRSVLLQGYPSIEYIVIDGSSSDHTIDFIKRYEKWFSWWVSEPDVGQSHAINKGFAKATGDIVAWLNSDDHYLPGTLNAVAECFIKYPSAGGWVGGTRQIDFRTGKIIWDRMPPPLGFEDLISGKYYYPTQPSCFLNRKVLCEDLYVDERYHMQMDFDLWLRIAKKHGLVPINQLLSVGYTHENCKTFRPELKSRSMAEKWTILLNHAGTARTADAIDQYLNGDIKIIYKIKQLAQNRFVKPFLPFLKSIFQRM